MDICACFRPPRRQIPFQGQNRDCFAKAAKQRGWEEWDGDHSTKILEDKKQQWEGTEDVLGLRTWGLAHGATELPEAQGAGIWELRNTD